MTMGIEIKQTHIRFEDSDDESVEQGTKAGESRDGGLIAKNSCIEKMVGTVVSARGQGNHDGYEVEEEEEEDSEVAIDLSGVEFDLYSILNMPRSSKDPKSKSRSCYHRQTAKWHPSCFRSRPIVCDDCGDRLVFGSSWMHKKGSTYDVCKDCHSGFLYIPPDTEADPDVGRGPADDWVEVEDLKALGEERLQYERELEKVRARDEAIVKFQRISLAYRVLKDEERKRIYDTCGWDGLVKAERYNEVNVFEEDAFAQYERFFSGDDEEDRQYLLIHGPQASDPEDEEDEEDEAAHPGKAEEQEGVDCDEDEEEISVTGDKGALVAKGIEEVPSLPMPPMIGGAFEAFAAAKRSDMGAGVPSGAWGLIASKVGEVVVGEDGQDGEEEGRKRGADTEAGEESGVKKKRGGGDEEGPERCSLRDGLPL